VRVREWKKKAMKVGAKTVQTIDYYRYTLNAEEGTYTSQHVITGKLIIKSF
jgi:hypothetical protein